MLNLHNVMNRLSSQASLYLRQHAHNPVDWHPWGAEAFARAAAEKKPLLVSIGYSTCHWCHVMERESFENAELAKFLNEHFVAIKVDREEHPEVDNFYMNALHLLTERGGWPLNMFVTPDRKPFYGGTYFPPQVFLDVLQQISRLWQEEPEKITGQATQLVDFLKSAKKGLQEGRPEKRLSLEQLRERKRHWDERLQEQMLRQFDPVWGGFGSAPKFPRAHGLSALQRTLSVNDEQLPRPASARLALLHTLRCMAYGGLRDHLGGGFHRYSTDAEWRVPHFEKMLYDQALLLPAYAEAFELSGETFFKDIVAETQNYLERDLRLAGGLWASATDADSEGVEGKFYVWSRAEVDELLKDEAPELRERFCELHSISERGNWDGTNVLCTPPHVPWDAWVHPEMHRLRQRLWSARQSRPAPARDDKVIAAWNAWMATGFFRAALSLEGRDAALSEKLFQSGEKTVVGLLQLAGPERRLPRVSYEGKGQGAAYLEDYAALAEALQWRALYRNSSALWEEAELWAEECDARFRRGHDLQPVAGSEEGASLPLTTLEDQDGATPSPFSVLVGVNLRRALVRPESPALERVLRDLDAVEKILDQYPLALSYLLTQLEALEMVLVKAPAGQAVARELWPGLVVPRRRVQLLEHPEKSFDLCELGRCFLHESQPQAVQKFLHSEDFLNRRF